MDEETKFEKPSLWQELKANIKKKREILLVQNDSELIPINQRKHSKEELEQVRTTLRPVYTSFPKLQRSFVPKFCTSLQDTNDITSNEQLSFVSTIIVTCNYFVGLGVLVIPYIYSRTGVMLLLHILLVGIVMSKTANILHRIQYIFGLESYPDIVETSLGYNWRIVLSYLFYLQLLLDCTFNMMVFLNSSIQLFPNQSHFKEPIEAAAVLAFIGIVQLVAFNPKLINTFSNLSSISGVVLTMTLFIGFYQDYQYKTKRDKGPIQSEQGSNLIPTTLDLVSAFGLSVGLFMLHTASPNIFRNMQKPSGFRAVINITFSIAILYYILIIILAYETYGDDVEENVINSIGLNPTTHFSLKFIINLALMTMAVSRFATISFPLLQNIEDLIIMLFRACVCVRDMDNGFKKSDIRDIHEDLATRFSVLKPHRFSFSDAMSPSDSVAAAPTNPLFSVIINTAKSVLPLVNYYLVTQVFKGNIILLLKTIGGLLGTSLYISFPIIFHTLIFWKHLCLYEKISSFLFAGIVFYLGIASIIIEVDQGNYLQKIVFPNNSSTKHDCLRH